jgi:hypothetical protein
MRDGKPFAVDEFVEVFDTPAMVKLIRQRYPSNPIMVYPDASGKNRKSQDASVSDIALLRQAQFTICANPGNPAVKDRVIAANVLIDRRDYRVNPDKCPHLVEALEQQPYDKHGEPDKKGGLDHVIDAATYFVVYRYPVAQRGASSVPLRI